MGTTREHLSERCAEEILRRFEKIWGTDRVQRHQDLGRRRFENDTFRDLRENIPQKRPT